MVSSPLLSVIFIWILYQGSNQRQQTHAWEIEDRGDPFLDLRFRQILTISCVQNESLPWTCPDHAECISASELGSVTNLCVCDENYVNPDPHQYGENENITIIYDEDEEEEGTHSHGEGAGGEGDTIVIGHDPESSFEYEDVVTHGRCVGRNDMAAAEGGGVKIEDTDPRWAFLRVPCNQELTGHPETNCPPNSECRNGKDCVCYDGWFGDPVTEYKECKGGASSTFRQQQNSLIYLITMLLMTMANLYPFNPLHC